MIFGWSGSVSNRPRDDAVHRHGQAGRVPGRGIDDRPSSSATIEAHDAAGEVAAGLPLARLQRRAGSKTREASPRLRKPTPQACSVPIRASSASRRAGSSRRRVAGSARKASMRRRRTRYAVSKAASISACQRLEDLADSWFANAWACCFGVLIDATMQRQLNNCIDLCFWLQALPAPFLISLLRATTRTTIIPRFSASLSPIPS